MPQKNNMPRALARENVCAVVVTHHPDQDFPARMETVAQETGGLVIVDNASSPSTRKHIAAALTNLPGARAVFNPQNLGIATALNQGAALAMESGFRFALLLDQDSLVLPGITENAGAVFTAASETLRAGLVATNHQGENTGPAAPPALPGERPWRAVKAAITSGTYLALDAYKDTGPFRDDYFIDLVDHEYCLRARAKGWATVMALEPKMRHSLGAATRHRLPGRLVCATNHNPVRRYFRARNSIALAGSYLFKEPRWVLKMLALWAESLVFVVLFEKDKGRKLWESYRGARDALLGRMGGYQ
jgi:rhamnosyltransferase